MNALTSDPEALVVGAGPVGLTAAAELARHEVRVRIIDKREGPVKYSQAAAVHVRTQEVLRAMGIVDGWLAAGHPMNRASLRGFGKRLGVLHPGGVDSPHPVPLVVGQDVTERLLVEHLDRLGITVERRVEAVRFIPGDGSVRVEMRHLDENDRSEAVDVPWVIDCEGSASKGREAAGIPFEGEHYEGQEFLMADARVAWSYPHGDSYMFLSAFGAMACFPFDGQGRYRVVCARPDEDPARREPPALGEIQELARRHAVDAGLTLSEPRWITRFRCQHRLAARFREGRLFLAGDSAHVHVPIGGQGMNYGIQDAFNLAWKLAAVIRGDARPEPLLDSYHAERRPAAAALIRGTDEGFQALIHASGLAQWAIKVFGPLALGWELVQDRIRTTLAEVNVAYPRSPLSEDRRVRQGPRAGERAPDAIVVRMPECRTIHLLDLFCRPRRWTLLLLGAPAGALAAAARSALARYAVILHAYIALPQPEPIPDDPAVGFLVDRELTLHEKYGLNEPSLYLIRPDGYVGFRGGLDHGADMLAYLDRIGFRGSGG